MKQRVTVTLVNKDGKNVDVDVMLPPEGMRSC